MVACRLRAYCTAPASGMSGAVLMYSLALISEMRGFVAYYWFDAGGGVMASTSIFEDRSHEEESNQKAASWVHENLSEVLPNPPTITAGHVVAQA